jgi:hypothetical protein
MHTNNRIYKSYLCKICGVTKGVRLCKCKKAFYCSKNCQLVDWKTHKSDWFLVSNSSNINNHDSGVPNNFLFQQVQQQQQQPQHLPSTSTHTHSQSENVNYFTNLVYPTELERENTHSHLLRAENSFNLDNNSFKSLPLDFREVEEATQQHFNFYGGDDQLFDQNLLQVLKIQYHLIINLRTNNYYKKLKEN